MGVSDIAKWPFVMGEELNQCLTASRLDCNQNITSGYRCKDSDHISLEIQSYAITIIITVIISVVVLFSISLVIIVCICLCCKYKQSSPDGKTVDTQSNQPTQPVPVYETVMECATVDLEMTENVAYAPIHTLS